jgi:hypothetical protein
MRKARPTLAPTLFVAALVLALPLTSHAQNREKFVISAKAGGVNAVTGRASMRPHGNTEWQQLTIKEDIETGDFVKTGLDGRVEMLLNPGSYLRIGENSEFELADNSLENLEVRLIRGTAVVEVNGADDEDLFIGITTPHARMSIVRRGLYRVNVVPGDTTELIVRKGRVMLEGSHTKVKGGNKVVFSSSSFSVAKLEKAKKKDWDALENWSKERAQSLTNENNKISAMTLNTLAGSYSDDWFFGGFFQRSFGFWLYSSQLGCFTFIPFFRQPGSPYGGGYSRFVFPGGFGSWGGPQNLGGPVYGVTRAGGSNPPASGGPSGPAYNPPASPPSRTGMGDSPLTSHDRPDQPARDRVRTPNQP